MTQSEVSTSSNAIGFLNTLSGELLQDNYYYHIFNKIVMNEILFEMLVGVHASQDDLHIVDDLLGEVDKLLSLIPNFQCHI